MTHVETIKPSKVLCCYHPFGLLVLSTKVPNWYCLGSQEKSEDVGWDVGCDGMADDRWYYGKDIICLRGVKFSAKLPRTYLMTRGTTETGGDYQEFEEQLVEQ